MYFYYISEERKSPEHDRHGTGNGTLSSSHDHRRRHSAGINVNSDGFCCPFCPVAELNAVDDLEDHILKFHKPLLLLPRNRIRDTWMNLERKLYYVILKHDIYNFLSKKITYWLPINMIFFLKTNNYRDVLRFCVPTWLYRINAPFVIFNSITFVMCFDFYKALN